MMTQSRKPWKYYPKSWKKKVTTQQPAAPLGRVVHCQIQRKPLPQILAPTHFPIPKKPFPHPWKKGQMATCNISISKHMLASKLPQYKSLFELAMTYSTTPLLSSPPPHLQFLGFPQITLLFRPCSFFLSCSLLPPLHLVFLSCSVSSLFSWPFPVHWPMVGEVGEVQSTTLSPHSKLI